MSREWVHVSVVDQIATVKIAKEPVNSMNTQLWTELESALTECEALQKKGEVRAAIFTSKLKRDVFTAGNDLAELYSKNTNEEKFTKFWVTSQRFLSHLFSSPLITAAAINGQCPAGGCILSLACDIRVMANDINARIGLNEVALGISVPKYWASVLSQTVGNRTCEKMLLNAHMPTADEALKIGLVDFAVSKGEVQTIAEREVRKLMKHPDVGRIHTKASFRKPLAEKWLKFAEEEAKLSWQVLSSPQVTAALGKVMSNLSAPKSKL